MPCLARPHVTDEEWELIADVFPEPTAKGRPHRDPRMVLDGILWILRTGALWRDIPAEFGPRKTYWKMFDHWNADGTLAEILRRMQAEHLGSEQLGSGLDIQLKAMSYVAMSCPLQSEIENGIYHVVWMGAAGDRNAAALCLIRRLSSWTVRAV